MKNGATFSIIFARLTQASKPIVAQISIQAGDKVSGAALDGFEINGHGAYATRFNVLGGRVSLIQLEGVPLG